MRHIGRQLVLMLQFFTRLPLPWQLAVTENDFRQGIIFMPFVGLVVGLVNWGTFMLFSWETGKEIGIMAVLFSNLWFTGGFHVDGLADTCDGIYSSRTRERMLEIMKDSRVGTNGACIIVLDLLLRWSGMHYLEEQELVLALLMMPLVARSCNPLLMHSKYARENGLGNIFIGKISIHRTMLSLLLGILISSFWISSKALFIIWGILIIFQGMFMRYITNILGGMTGDTLGAGDELSELMVLVLLCMIKQQGVDW